MAGMVLRNPSAKSHSTPSVSTSPIIRIVAAALTRRRSAGRDEGFAEAAYAGTRCAGVTAGAGACGALAVTATRGDDGVSASVAGTGGAIGRASVSATGSVSTTATAPPRTTGTVAGVS